MHKTTFDSCSSQSSVPEVACLLDCCGARGNGQRCAARHASFASLAGLPLDEVAVSLTVLVMFLLPTPEFLLAPAASVAASTASHARASAWTPHYARVVLQQGISKVCRRQYPSPYYL
jgi:hypothetical protein